MDTKDKNIHQELIDRCRANDKNAQYELYKIYYKPMYNTSLRILNDPAEAEDVMQESFLAAFRKIEDYTGEGNFGGWLRRIVVNNSIDALKKRHLEISFVDESNLPETAVEDGDPEEQTAYKIAEIKGALQMLPEDHRVIISLFLYTCSSGINSDFLIFSDMSD